MQVDTPEWFILIPIVLAIGFIWRRLNLFTPLRIIILIVLSTILASPRIEKIQDALDIWVLLDRSASTEDLVDKGFSEWHTLLKQSKPSPNDRIHIIDYASEVSLQLPGTETANFSGKRTLTRTPLAIENVLAMAAEDRPSRILLFTDGFATEPFNDILDKLNKKSIPLDYRLIRENIQNDFRIASIDLPERVQINEPFLLGITVRGHKDQNVPITIYRDDQQLESTSIKLVNGVGKIEFSTRIPKSGAYNFSARITPDKDAHIGNNVLNRWIQITGGPRILLATNYTNDPLAAALTAQGFTVDIVPKPSELRVGQLAGARAVIFNNVPAYEVPIEFLNALTFYVQEQGGGFLMVGGKKSFGSGGYFGSALDELLPVSMELKNDHRKLSVALSIVMDRSGSMSMTVPGPGGKAISKMQLAGSGAATAIDLLGATDYIQLNAVDSDTHVIIPPQQIQGNKASLMQKARRVRSEGGGIYVYRGLEDAWKELAKINLGTRHIILFSDAADSEEPGNYKTLLQDITENGGSVSVIGLGSKSDPDARLLEDIADRGNGRIFFTNRAIDIPKLFAQETVTIARSSFIEEPVSALPTGLWSELSPKPLPWLPSIDGYNLSYAKPNSTTALISKDEYQAPLVSFSRSGLGRTAAISFPMGGEFSQRARDWSQYEDFIQTLSRWLMGFDLPQGLGVRHKLDGTNLTIDLFYDQETLGSKLSNKPPTIKIQDDSSPQPHILTWRRIAPGHFSLNQNLEEGTIIRGAIQAADTAIPFGPIQVGTSAEWAFDSDNIAELRNLSAQTNGRELTDLSKAWLRPQITRQADIRLPLLIILLALILLDALITRTGYELPSFKKSTTPQPPKKLNAPTLKSPEAPTRQSRYARAKNRQ